MSEELSPSQPVPAPKRERPPAIIWVTVAFLAAFALLGGLSAVALGVAYANGKAVGAAVPASIAVTAALAIVYLVVAIFVLRGAAWARWLGVSVGVLNIVVALVSAVTGGGLPNCLGILLQAGVLVLLLRREIADWCLPR